MRNSAKRAAVWGYRLEVGRVEEIRAWPLVAVRVTLGGTHQFARLRATPTKMGKPLLSRAKVLGSSRTMKDCAAVTGGGEEGF